MSIRVIIHVLNDEAVMADLDELPDPKDNCIVVRNPRRRDGKPLNLLADGVNALIYPWTRITYVEVLDEMAGTTTPDSIVGFFREDGSTS